MPHHPTRSRLMRRARTAETPPICKSKDDATGIVSICDCPECENCEQVEFYDGQFDAMMEFIDTLDDQCGAWEWDGDEDDDADSGEFNNCIPPGQGNGQAQYYDCHTLLPTTLRRANNLTYPQWLLFLGLGPAGQFWVGDWISDNTSQSFPTNGNNC